MPGWAACVTPVSQAGGGTWQAHNRAGRDVCRLRATASQPKPRWLNRRSEQPVGQAAMQRVPPLQPGPVAWPGHPACSSPGYLWGQWALDPFVGGSCWGSCWGFLLGVPSLQGDCWAGLGWPTLPGKEFGPILLGLCVCPSAWGAHYSPVFCGVEGLGLPECSSPLE